MLRRSVSSGLNAAQAGPSDDRLTQPKRSKQKQLQELRLKQEIQCCDMAAEALQSNDPATLSIVREFVTYYLDLPHEYEHGVMLALLGRPAWRGAKFSAFR